MTTRAVIVRIGDWDHEEDRPVGWIFKGGDVGLKLFADGRPPRMGGYTLDELREIWRRRRVI